MQNFGRYTVSNYLAPSQPLTVDIGIGWEYIRIINNSPYLLGVNLSGVGSIDFPEMFLEDMPVPQNFTGKLTITPTANLVNTSQSISNLVSINTYAPGELEIPQTQPLTQQAVNVTGSGKPIYSATIGFGSTASTIQALNVFNPANSGITYIFHSCRVFTNDSTVPAANLILVSGADLNLGIPVSAVSHEGSANPPTSTAHCTAEDIGAGHGGTTIEVLDCQQNTTMEFESFPDSYTLEPGNNLRIALTSGSTGKVVRLTMKWTEDTQIAGATLGVNMSILTAATLVNDGNATGTGIIESTPSGQSSSATHVTNDGQWLLQVLQSGVYHQFLKSQTSGDPLQLGQSGDIVDLLGGLNLAGISTVVNGNGTGGGTATVYQLLSGAVKLVVVIESNFKNQGAVQTVALNAAFTVAALAITSKTNGINFVSGGVQQSINIITGLPSSAGPSGGGTVTAQAGGGNGEGAYSVAALPAFDTLSFTGGNGSASTGVMFIIGS